MITLSKLLSTFNDRELVNLATRHGVTGKALTRPEMIDALQSTLADPAYLRTCIAKLSPPSRLLLRGIVAYGGLWDASRYLKAVLGRNPESHSSELRSLGLLSNGGEVPVEVERIIGRLWAEELRSRDAGEPSDGLDPTGPGAMRNLFCVLGMAFRRELPLTQQGAVYKKAEDQLFERAEDSVQLTEGAMALFALEYAQRRGLVAPTEYSSGSSRAKLGLALTPLAETWAEQSWAAIWTDMAIDLIEATRDYFPAVRLALLTLAGATPGSWLSVTAWAKEFDRMSGGNSLWGAATGRGLITFLTLLTGLELLHRQAAPKGESLVQPTPALLALLGGRLPDLPEAETGFYLQPNFELLVPRTVSPAVLFQLERLAGNRRADRVLQYSLSSASLRPALEAGLSAESIMSFFQRHSKNPLPPNVLSALQEWTAGAARARFEAVTLLRLDNPETAVRVTGDRTLNGLVHGSLTPTDLIVDAQAVDRIRKRLGEMGIVTMPGISQPENPTSGGTAPLPPKRGGRSEKPTAPTKLVKEWFGGPLEAAATVDLPPVSVVEAPATTGGRTPANQAECAAWLRSHAAAGEIVRITYEGEESLKVFTVHPMRVLDDRLVAYCEEAGAQRKYKLARIKVIEPTGESFQA